jgi:phosphoserine phosphatase RsbX
MAVTDFRSRQPAIEWGVAELALQDAAVSGDCYVVQPYDTGTLVAVIDGLGHGHDAAVASQECAARLRAHPERALEVLVDDCHRALLRTRGAAMTLARLDPTADTLTWIGIGNVEATVVKRSAKGITNYTALLCGGVVGYKLPRLRRSTVELSRGDTLVFATDGIRGGYTAELPLTESPKQIAEWILSGYSKQTDDALTLVGRYIGGAL